MVTSPPDIPEILICLDGERAFDRVEWDYSTFFIPLRNLAKFVTWIKILSSSPMAVVRTNNNLSSFLSYKEAQDRVVPLLFAIAIELLALALQQDTNIKGIYWWSRMQSIAFC